VVVTGNGQVCDALARADDREAAIVALTVDGYTQEEIAEVLGEKSIRAVEGVLHRWRKKEQHRRGKGGA
jgi:transposase